ncbi:MAG TPA: hypothetical protein DCE42_29860 [Myxococcales bacterium]|nr:hypothetical protein [Deltaproteobacteria bacterium]HAA58998.1 hypothetical protein [Myxococcales bacterium]
MNTETPSKKRHFLHAMLALFVGVMLWLPCIQCVYTPRLSAYVHAKKIAPRTQKLASTLLADWKNPHTRKKLLTRMRKSNAEWDFMGRSFLVWALANMSLRTPKQKDLYIELIDSIIDDTLTLERTKGMAVFMLPYVHNKPFVMQPARSQFLDGEIALMMGVRRLVREHLPYKKEMRKRINIMVSRMKKSPTMSLESYPDEVWLFCNTTSLAAIKVGDALDKTDHSVFFRRWIQTAKKKLIHRPSGILISAFTLKGRTLQGPEGSSIWMSIHHLMLIDKAFAKAQYTLAKKQLIRGLYGFSYAKEWPPTWKAASDIDSGTIVPFLGASASSSGFALVASATMKDHALLKRLLASLQLAGFPRETDKTLQFLASNQVGSAVMLYALVQGPIWEKVIKKTTEKRSAS